MPEPSADEAFLLALLNSTPIADGAEADLLAAAPRALQWLAIHGGRGTAAELDQIRAVRYLLQAVVRSECPPEVLAGALQGVTQVPAFKDGRVEWALSVPAERALAARAVLTWDALARTRPGRLRPCGNAECRLFLLDHSKANAARWCSMATCGNRIKARRHYQRTREGTGS